MNLDKKLHNMHETAFLCQIYCDLRETAVKIHELDDNVTTELLAVMDKIHAAICEQD